MTGEEPYSVRSFKKRLDHRDYKRFILGADVGGTNTNIGVSGLKKGGIDLLYVMDFKTRELKSLAPAIREVMGYSKTMHKIRITDSCIAAAGPVSKGHDRVKLTNGGWGITVKEVLKTGLRSTFIINDFEALGYAVNILRARDFVHVGGPMKGVAGGTRALVGAGTGLGKTILAWSGMHDAYIPIASEGGHSDFPAYDDQELALTRYIRKENALKGRVTWEDVLSGRGIRDIYGFLRKTGELKLTRVSREIDSSEDKTPLIAGYKNVDPACRMTFRMYSGFYGRCCKNFALDTLSRGGLYICGGVASKNPEIFDTRYFMDEFRNGYGEVGLMEKIPVKVMTDYDASVKGACFAAHKRKDLRIGG
ncbi:glucokinase [Candidatus Altiarchaeota archaeon]